MSTEKWLFLFALLGALGGIATVTDVLVKLLKPITKDMKSKQTDLRNLAISRRQAWAFFLFWLLSIVLSIVGFYRSFAQGPQTQISSTDETELRFASWWPFPDGSGCGAVIDASKLPVKFRDDFEIALVCGFSDPAVDRFKDTRITLSPLFTPQNALSVSVPFSKIMAESLANDQEAAIKKLQPHPPRGTVISLNNQIWMRIVLLHKGFDTANIHKLTDVTLHGGKIATAEVGVGIARNVPAR